MGNKEQDEAAKKAAEEQAAKEAVEKAAKEAEEKAAKGDKVFDANPQLDVYYKTSDGLAFYTQNTAELHAAGLKDKTVKKVTK
jgi:hypothetical protein